MVTVYHWYRAFISICVSPLCDSLVKPLASEDEYGEEGDDSRENIGDDEHEQKRRKILLKVVTCLAWVEQSPSLP